MKTAKPALAGRPRPQNSCGDSTASTGSVLVSEFLDTIFDAAISAGLAHEVSWLTVWRILANLPDEDNPCPYCGGLLQRWSSAPRDCAWRCQACGRLHIPVSDEGRPNRAQAAEVGRQARDSWRAVEARLAQRGVA